MLDSTIDIEPLPPEMSGDETDVSQLKIVEDFKKKLDTVLENCQKTKELSDEDINKIKKLYEQVMKDYQNKVLNQKKPQNEAAQAENPQNEPAEKSTQSLLENFLRLCRSFFSSNKSL